MAVSYEDRGRRRSPTREHEAAPLAQRDDLVHRDGVGHAGTYPADGHVPLASAAMATTVPAHASCRTTRSAGIAWRRYLHANPELSFEEHETSAFVEQTLRSFGGLEIERPADGGRGAAARRAAGKTVVLRADMDALADPRGERHSYISTPPA